MVLPDCDLFDKEEFRKLCKHTDSNKVQNRCNCASFINCDQQVVQECPETTIFNPCTESCALVSNTTECPDFCTCYDEDNTPWKGNCYATFAPPTTTSQPSSDSSSGLALGLGIGIPILFLVLILAFCLWRKRRWAKTPDRYPTPWYQALLLIPCLPCRILRTKIMTEHQNRKEDNFGFQKKGYSSKLVYEVSKRTEPSKISNGRMTEASHVFKDAHIFPLDLLEMGKTLGRGAYGKVFKGWIKLDKDLLVEVAIKTCTRSTGSEDIEREARVFLKLKERHMNIVNLLGVCIPPEKEINPMLLLELCEGNLEKHLHRNCDKFIEADDKNSKVLNASGEFSSRSLLKFCYQVSRGMDFLEKNKIVHGDLAARNILLANDGTVAKVSDFGLSRSLYSSVEELSNASSGLPVRWMAPEVLTKRLVTNKSDIWSFGVLMWEIFSLGAVPYLEISEIDLQFTQDLSDGVRSLGDALYKVPKVQDSLDAVRLSALQLKQDYRPSFAELSPQLWTVLSEASRDDYKRLESEYVRYISLIAESYEQLMLSKRQTTSI